MAKSASYEAVLRDNGAKTLSAAPCLMRNDNMRQAAGSSCWFPDFFTGDQLIFSAPFCTLSRHVLWLVLTSRKGFMFEFIKMRGGGRTKKILQ